MRCYCCNNALTDYEASIRITSTDEYADVCLKCLEGLRIPTKGNYRLRNKRDLENEEIPQTLDDVPLDIRQTDWEED